MCFGICGFKHLFIIAESLMNGNDKIDKIRGSRTITLPDLIISNLIFLRTDHVYFLLSKNPLTQSEMEATNGRKT